MSLSKRLVATALVLIAASATLPAACDSASASAVDVPLSDLIERAERIIPDHWRIVEADTASLPVGWTGQANGLHVMVEDSRTRFLHPNGFHYYSFYRIWLMPPGWEGVMRHTPYVSDSVPAFLLGANDQCVAFYHTAGGNIWPDGPESLCDVLGLDRICYTDLTRRIVDLEIEERLTSTPPDAGAFAVSPQQIVGLTGDGPNLYIEYVFPTEESEDELLAALTDELANSVFDLIPEVESLYLRRCTSNTFTDTIVTRN